MNFFMKKEGNDLQICNEIEKGGYQRTDWDSSIPDRIWNKISVKDFNPKVCELNYPYKDSCFYYAHRQKLLYTCDFIICNQDLLTINLKKRNNEHKQIITKKCEFVVIDEAHNLESKVRNCYTTEINYNYLEKGIEQSRKKERDLSDIIDEKIGEYYESLDQIFADLEKQIQKQDRKAQKDEKKVERYYVNRDIDGLERIINCIHDIYLQVSIQFFRRLIIMSML